MFVVMVGIESGEVARRGVSGRSGRRNFAGRISRASSVLSNGGDGGNFMSSGCICSSCIIAEETDGSVKAMFVSSGGMLSKCWQSAQSWREVCLYSWVKLS